MMMGRLGPDTLAAGALGTNLYFVALIFGIGLLNAVTPMIARETGRASSRVCDVRKIAQQGFWSAGYLAIPGWLALWWSQPLLARPAILPRIWRMLRSVDVASVFRRACKDTRAVGEIAAIKPNQNRFAFHSSLRK
jgi:hypothetical protein